MYLEDPLAVPQAFVPKVEAPDFRSEFWRETPDLRPTQGHDRPATLRICVYKDGRHEMPPKSWCPHFEREDEVGKRIRPDWTVQQDG